MKASIFRIVFFLLLLFFILQYADQVFRVKYAEGISQLDTFYELENNTVDVLILGSSHAFVNFNNGVLWDEYGMASYNLGGANQPMWNTYYYLKEALKTQKPELIVLEGFALAFGEMEYTDDASIIKNTYGMRWSPDKVNAIMVSTPPDKQREMLMTYGQYHSRYTSLNRGDFLLSQDLRVETNNRVFYRYWKGQFLFNTSNPQIAPDISGVTDSATIPPKEELYYRKTIELAIDNGIPIIVTIAPCVLNEDQQKYFNQGAVIANEYGIEFLNCNTCIPEIGVDYSKDFNDISHMTCVGSQKFSSYFGKHIKDRYSISDRRGDPHYVSWQKNADYSSQFIKDYALICNTDIISLSLSLVSDEYDLIITTDGSGNTYDEALRGMLDALGIAAGESGIWYRTKDGIIWKSGNQDADKYLRNSLHDIHMSRNDGVNAIRIDNRLRQVVDNGINIVVYDRVLETVIDCIGIDNTDHSITHSEEMHSF